MAPILCINDNQIHLFLQKRLILQSGITDTVITLNDGREALEYYSNLQANNETEYPTLILLDIHMPVVDGWEFLDKFIELYLPSFPESSVIINSFTIDSEEMERAKDYPVVIDFLNSPLSVDYITNLSLSASKF